MGKKWDLGVTRNLAAVNRKISLDSGTKQFSEALLARAKVG